MARGSFDPNEIIADWRGAYLAANGFEATHSVRYERGWFIFHNAGEGVNRRRRFDVEDMTGRLKRRAQEVRDNG